jgi:hypothetical protein
MGMALGPGRPRLQFHSPTSPAHNSCDQGYTAAIHRGCTKGHSGPGAHCPQTAKRWVATPVAQNPDEEAAEEWEGCRWDPPLPTSGILFAYRRNWDLFPLAVFQPKPKLMLSR